MSQFRVALSGDFLNEDGSPAYPMFDLGPLTADPGISISYVHAIDGVMPALEGFDALILLASRFDERSIARDGRLKIVARFGVGYDTVDVSACTDAGIIVATAPDGVRRPVAVSILTFLFALSGQLLHKDRLTRMGAPGWDLRSEYMGVGLTGRKFGQLGIGNIGAEVIRLAKPLDMTLIAHDPHIDPALASELGVTLVSLEDLFRDADFLSISVPLSETTRGMVDARLLGMMKPTAYIINTARGPIIDQKALYDALASGRIAGAGLDVFEVEPAPADEPILQLDNVIVTPHSLCYSDECFAGLGADCVQSVLAVKRGDLPKSVVNPEVFGTPRWLERSATTIENGFALQARQ